MGGIYWLASYPKSGNTWFRVFLCNLRLNSEQPANINALGSEDIASSRAWLDDVLGIDSTGLDHDELDRLRPAVYRWSARESREHSFHKIHDAYTYPDGNEPLVSREATLGALYLIRNPLDVVLSYAAHRKVSINDAIELMGDRSHALNDFRTCCDMQTRQLMLTWSEHVLSWVDAPGLNCLVVRFEDMLAHPVDAFTRAVEFLQLPHDRSSIDKAIHFSRFSELKRQEQNSGFWEKPPSTQNFFRQGKSGGWRGQLSQTQIANIIEKHGVVMRRFGYLDEHGNPV